MHDLDCDCNDIELVGKPSLKMFRKVSEEKKDKPCSTLFSQ